MLIKLSLENYKTHDFEEFGWFSSKICKNCKMVLHRDNISVKYNLSCNEFVIKNIIQ